MDEKGDASSFPVVAPPGQARAEASCILPRGHTKGETLVVETALASCRRGHLRDHLGLD